MFKQKKSSRVSFLYQFNEINIYRSKHFSRALNESVDVHIKHLDPSWCGYNPLHREKGFYSLCASDKVN